MDVMNAIKLYINRMIDECGVGMKVLLMDKETIAMISIAFAQSIMLQKEVYLFERIDLNSTMVDQMKYLKCLVFVRPTHHNIDLLCRELKSPRFGQYHIYFSNIISKTDIKLLAESDEQELVKDVQEFYCDYVAVSPHLFSVNTRNCYEGIKNCNQLTVERTTQAIISVLLALRKNPTIRYQANSELCKRISENIRQTIARESVLFDFRKSGNSNDNSVSTVLLIIDRKFDVITPLLNQWTYQAMVHELLTITNNRVNLSEVPGITKDLKEVVLSQEHDEFYERNLYLNYGEIGSNIKELMDEFQAKTKSHQKVETIADMKTFIENYPQFKKMSGTVSKHVTIIGELSRLVSSYNLFEVSEAEQEIACQLDHSESLKKIKRLLANDKVRELDALRLTLLYALRFEKHSNNDIQGLIDALKRRGVSDKLTKLVNNVLEFSASKRQSSSNTAELLTTENVKAFTKKMIKGLKGVENIYTQHTPLIKEIVEDLSKGKLKEVQYPYLGTVQLREKPQEIILFIVGGATYDESSAIYQLNKSLIGTKIILGTTFIHNFKSFLEEISHFSNTANLQTYSAKNNIL